MGAFSAISIAPYVCGVIEPKERVVVGKIQEISMQNACLCCAKKQKVERPCICPECGHVFQGNGWDGIDAHWRSKHEHVMTYRDFWDGLCPRHKGKK